MADTVTLSRTAKIYLWSISAIGSVAILVSLYGLYTSPIGYQWFLLAILTLISGSATVKLASVPATISISETFVFTAVILFGTNAGTITVALDGLVMSYWLARKRPEVLRVLFNVGTPALSIWIGANLFFLSSGAPPLVVESTPIRDLIIPLILFAVTYFSLNSGLIALAVAFERHVSAFAVWRDNFLWLSLNYFGGASISALFVVVVGNLNLSYPGFVASLLLVVPLIVVLYLTFHTSMARIEDTNRHLDELNALYLSTIETLAMAIDAKDQVTHGHIRRVQRLAVALATAMGVRDEAELKAIKAASLLHDTGKLAVPEYILNKPGPLTPSEFEKIKLHSSVGADILSAIRFPFPVVPIVRHHHESWDGSGYPDSLKGSSIPIGARILSVVDCFDALTSDRPYRPRLSESDAIRILMTRRGTMYDPDVVDAFLAIYRNDASMRRGSEADADDTPSFSKALRSAAEPPRSGLEDINASAEETRALYALAHDLSGEVAFLPAGDTISRHLQRWVPASLYVVYVHHPSTHDLVAHYTSGQAAAMITGLRVPLGFRLCGWVAANRSAIVNSDPVLDLGETARSVDPPLRSCLAVPLIDGPHLVGVISLYSAVQDVFTENHRRIVEAIAHQAARKLHILLNIEMKVAESGSSERRGRIEPTLAPIQVQRQTSHSPLSLICVQVEHSTRLTLDVREDERRDLMMKIIQATEQILRSTDVLLESANNSFIVFLKSTDKDAAKDFAARVTEIIRRITRNMSSRSVHIWMGVASSPDDASDVGNLVTMAQRLRTKVISDDDLQGTIH